MLYIFLHDTVIFFVQAINVNFTGSQWKGLEYGNQYSLLDGSVDKSWWMYAIGSFETYWSGIPSFDGGQTIIVELYVRCYAGDFSCMYVSFSKFLGFGGNL